MAENVTLWNTSIPRIERKYSGGPENVTLGDRPENVTVPGYGNTPRLEQKGSGGKPPTKGAKDWIPAYAGMRE